MSYVFDSDGLIYSNEPGAGGYGDCCAETFRYLHLQYARIKLGIPTHQDVHWLRIRAEEVSKLFCDDIEKGTLIRAPRRHLPLEWPDPVSDFARDQHMPMILALGALFGDIMWKDWHPYRLALKHLKSRFWIHQNGDLALPHLPNILRRCDRSQPKVLGDLGIWGTVLPRCGKLPVWDAGLKEIQFGDPNDVEDDINLIHILLQAEYAGHTRISSWAKDYYSKNRAPAREKHKNKVMAAVCTYYHHSPWLLDLYEPVIDRVFKS